jgi:hypothetical protein
MNKRFVAAVALRDGTFVALAQDAIPERQMTLRQGPDSVFDRPPGEILPALAGATATGEASGTVVRRSCRNITVVGPGDIRPGCEDRVESTSMAVGLVTCG